MAYEGATVLLLEDRKATFEDKANPRYKQIFEHSKTHVEWNLHAHHLWPAVAGAFCGTPSAFMSWTDTAALLQLFRNMDVISDAATAHDERHGGWGLWPPPPVPYVDTLTAISSRLEVVEAPACWRSTLAQGSFTELQNGAPSNTGWGLEKAKTFAPLGAWINYRDLCEGQWKKPDGKLATWEGFWRVFNRKACTEWGKMDTLGVCVYEDWDMCRETNARALFALPYPKRAVLWVATVLGCGNRFESVPYVRAVCEWVKRVEAACGPYGLVAEARAGDKDSEDSGDSEDSEDSET